MKIDKRLEKFDPSRYTVYQMLDYTKKIQDIELHQKLFKDIYLFKTKPFVNTLYNYAHIIKDNLLEEELKKIKDFFGKEPFRIKIKDNEKLRDFLINHEMKFKDIGNIMVNKDINEEEHNYSLEKGVKLSLVNNENRLNDYKLIFSEAFNCSSQDTNKKFGFLDKIILDSKNNHVNVFVIYENGIPASTGAYFAFDHFSVENIGTKNAFRGKGYAYKIMQHLLKEAQRLKYNQACLVASEAGSRVYQKVGFKLLTRTNTLIPN
jgi:ribosomal protein S18 acetylase RimI-like enzyme